LHARIAAEIVILQMSLRYVAYSEGMDMTAETIGFAVRAEDRPELDRLVNHFGGGNRSHQTARI